MDLRAKVRAIKDFPKEGIVFRDITTLIKDADAFREVIDIFTKKIEEYNVDAILVLDARGFLIGSPVAYILKKGVVPIRKAGKLPAESYQVSYELEYGTDCFEMHKDAVEPGMKIAIVDDLLATGGTAKAACELVKKAGGVVSVLGFVIELEDLGGRANIGDYEMFSLINY